MKNIFILCFREIYFYIQQLLVLLINDCYNATLIVAMDNETRGVGFENTLPWKLSSDLKEFKKITSKSKRKSLRNCLICGRVTYESLGCNILPNRNMIVITKNIDFFDDKLKVYPKRYLSHNISLFNFPNGEKLIFVSDLRAVIYAILELSWIELGVPNIFIIGGSKIYNLFLNDKIEHIKVNRCIITHINNDSKTFTSLFNKRYDTFFPFDLVLKSFKEIKQKVLEEGVIIKVYKRKFINKTKHHNVQESN